MGRLDVKPHNYNNEMSALVDLTLLNLPGPLVSPARGTEQAAGEGRRDLRSGQMKIRRLWILAVGSAQGIF